MKILLINPPYKKEEVFSYLADSAPVLPPLGLAYLAAYLRNNSYQVSILDGHALDFDIDRIVKEAISYKPQLIGIASNSPLYFRVLRLGEGIKRALPDSKIVLGGYHPTFLSREVLVNGLVDFVVCGEGEETLLELCRALENGEDFFTIKGLGFKNQGKIIINSQREFIKDLDKLPFPAYGLLPLNNYHLGDQLNDGNNAISIMASRGCPSNCYFCTSPGFWKNIYRKHSPSYIVALMNYLYENYKKSCFQFRDDTFTLDKQWLNSLCKLILTDSKYKFKWDCYARFDTLDEPTLRRMKEAGCYALSLGVESANDNILREVKGFTKKQVYRGMELLKRYNFKTRLFFMVGPPARDCADIDKITDFAIELDPDILIVTASIPYPGSRFYSEMVKNGIRVPFDKQIPKVYEGFCDFDNFNKEYIRRKTAQIYKIFYLRSSYIIKRLFLIRSLSDFHKLVLGGLSMIKMMAGNVTPKVRSLQSLRNSISRYKKYFRFVRKKPFLIARIIKVSILGLFFRRRILRKLEITITYDCQCKCEKCSSFKLKRANSKELSLEEIKKIAKQAYDLGVFRVNFMGGEPLLRKDLIEIINCFKANSTFLSISTNGALLTERKIKELKKAGIDCIKISLDSPIESEHDQKRGYPGLFNIIMRTVDYIKAEGLLCELSSVVTKESIKSGKIWDLVQLSKEKGETVALGVVVPAVCGRWAGRYDVLLDEEERKVLDKLVKYSHVIRDIQTGLFHTQCAAGREQIYITAYGDVLPCSIVQISFGNIKKELLRKIWDKIQKSGIFKESKKLCLAGEDKKFIYKYLKPISQMEKMPVTVEHLRSIIRDA